VSWSTQQHGIARGRRLRWGLAVWAFWGAGACAGRRLPDVRDATRAYDDAVRRGDAQALFDMMTEGAQRAWRVSDVQQILADERAELRDRSHALTDPSSAVRATARLRLSDGGDATLDVEDGAFRISSAGGLPAAARTPAQALEQLRSALARRSYAALLRVLAPSTRTAVESDIRALVDGLSHSEGLEVQISGDVASVQIEGGHFVRLRLDAGVWKVEDFD
jgi:ketosteroid isomerase-like protein